MNSIIRYSGYIYVFYILYSPPHCPLALPLVKPKQPSYISYPIRPSLSSVSRYIKKYKAFYPLKQNKVLQIHFPNARTIVNNQLCHLVPISSLKKLFLTEFNKIWFLQLNLHTNLSILLTYWKVIFFIIVLVFSLQIWFLSSLLFVAFACGCCVRFGSFVTTYHVIHV